MGELLDLINLSIALIFGIYILAKVVVVNKIEFYIFVGI